MVCTAPVENHSKLTRLFCMELKILNIHSEHKQQRDDNLRLANLHSCRRPRTVNWPMHAINDPVDTCNVCFFYQNCPAGFYCDNRLAPVVLYQNSTCPPGYYCPNGTTHGYEFPCPQGTFSNISGLVKIGECSPCPGGYYCDEMGQTTYTKLCDGGENQNFCLWYKYM